MLIDRLGLETYTDRTVATLPELMRDLAEARVRGWAVDDEERNLGMRCVAAAVFNEHGEPVGGVSVSGPTVRVTPERLAQIGPVVRDAAAEVTTMIGGRN
jgi:IclR family acetate operon transcriptional repressor